MSAPPSSLPRPVQSERGRRRRQAQLRRRRLVASLVVLAVVGALVVVVRSLVGGGSGAPGIATRTASGLGTHGPSPSGTATSTGNPTGSTGAGTSNPADTSNPAGGNSTGGGSSKTTVSNSVSTTATPPTTVDPGTLAQTNAFPTTTSPSFAARMAALWQGVVTDQFTSALPAFFPETAYVQLKAVSDPSSDFAQRLVAGYGRDLSAAHALLGPQAATAQFVGVDVDSSYGHWVPPGTCYNEIGYFEVPNSRVVYRLNGQVRSFGIASMISWRGEWYVVHLGSVAGSATGTVDDPEPGPGTPAYSSTC